MAKKYNVGARMKVLSTGNDREVEVTGDRQITIRGTTSDAVQQIAALLAKTLRKPTNVRQLSVTEFVVNLEEQ